MKNGTILNGTYQILYPIASGGLGEIYLGYHMNLHKNLVIKKVKDKSTGIVNNRIEADILKGLHHTYLPQVYDFIQTDTGVFTVMDYISGHDLKYYLDQGYQFSEEQVILWMKQLCQVLEYLHGREQPIIHCDIKPGNIMITEQGNICLIDFNISLDGENNKELVGLSSTYASPEQVKKAEYKLRYGTGDYVKMDGRTDIYSLGAVFYYVMSGISPNRKEGVILPLKELEHIYSEELANIVDKAMEKDPSRRFKSASKMLEALEHKERWSKRYLYLTKLGLVADVVVGCLGIVLICLMALGYRGMKKDDFFQAYDTFMQQAVKWEDVLEEETAQEILTEGLRLLNHSDYKKQFSEYQKEKTDVLYEMSRASVAMEKYYQAEEFLEEVLLYRKNDPLVYRDLAIIQVYLQKMSQAETYMGKALALGLSEPDGMLIRAEIALEEKEYEKAWKFARKAASSDDLEILTRVSVILLEAGEELGKNEECIQFFDDMSKKYNGSWKYIWMRKEGELCLKVIENGKKEYLEQARSCLEELWTGGYAQLADLYNLATVYNTMDMLQEEKELLLEMEQKYPDEYEICIRLAYVCYRMENDRTKKINDYREAEQYYKKAVRICEQQNLTPETDPSVLQMGEIISQLRKQGWLQE